MNILSIADNHDAGAALFINGELKAAVNQERIDRIKNSGAFPWGAIDATLERAACSAKSIDKIVIATSYTPSVFLRLFPQMHAQQKTKSQFSNSLHAYLLYQSLLKRSGFEWIEQRSSHAVLKRKLAKFSSAPIVLMDHHRSHAEGAYRTQPHKKALVLTLDAMGDGTTATAWMGRDGTLVKLWDQSGLAAINLFYSQITELLGFKPLRHEGKITGLAAFAKPDRTLLKKLRERYRFAGGRFSRINPLQPSEIDDPLWKFVAQHSKEVIAATAQELLEEATLSFVLHWINKTQCRNIAVAGGVFANVKLNQCIAQHREVESLWVFPHMGDGGLAVGGGLAELKANPAALKHIYWGNELNSIDKNRAIQRAQGVKIRSNVLHETAKRIARGDLIARCSGGMEWGPRALGNRSILAHARNPQINDTLNKKLGRTEFMPFAPLVRDVDAERFFINSSKAMHAARFMTVCFKCTDAFKKAAPATVHIDGTARPQILQKDQNPELYELMTILAEEHEIPALINTSFNLHEEPIIATPDEAVRAWRSADLDGLLMEDVLLVKHS
ncbi:MAG: hypothetical protein CMK59_07035 [Proteobacteria bacterium]|nr:hypothetical protein [Pseudomonadota bacterium]